MSEEGDREQEEVEVVEAVEVDDAVAAVLAQEQSAEVEEAAEEEPVQEEPVQEEPAQEEPAQEEPAQEEPAQEEPAQEEPAQEEPAQEEPAQEEPAQEEPAQEEPAQEEPAQEEPAQEEPAQEETAQEEPAQEETAEEEPAQEETAEMQPSKEQPSKKEPSEEPAKEEEPAKDETGPQPLVEGMKIPEGAPPVADPSLLEAAGQVVGDEEASPVTLRLKELGAEVVERFRQQHRHVSPVLATFVVSVSRVAVADADWSAPPGREEGARLVEAALERLAGASCPTMETIRMQVAFESVYAVAVQRLQAMYDGRREKNQAQLARVLDLAANLSSNEQVAGLYRAFFRLLLDNGSVRTVDRQVEREVAAALESVFPQSGLNAFSLSTPAERRGHVTDLVSVVLGIRLFNRHIGKGGAGLDDVPATALRESTELGEALRAGIAAATQLCGQYTQVLQHEFRRPGSIGGAVPVLRDELANRRQLLLFYQQLQHEADESLREVHAGRDRLEAALERLRKLVSDRASVPKEEVYPLFHELAVIWTGLEAETDKNRSRRTLLAELARTAGGFETSLSPRDLAASELRRAADEAEADAEEARPFDFVRTPGRGGEEGGEKETAGGGEGGDEGSPVRLVQHSTPGFFSIALEFQGFCPWSVVRREGFLVPGNPVLGVIRWRGRHYSLAGKEAMREFCADPERYVLGVETAARRAPHLINVLGLQDDVPGGSVHDLLPLATATGIGEMDASGNAVSIDADCQTETHPLEPGVDHQYAWNEWDLRRRAIQLANLTGKRTHSTQTSKSHFRRENEAQTYLKRPGKDGVMPGRGTQTGISKGTNVARESHYIAGLRGRPDGPAARVVALTLDSVVTNGTNRPFN